MQLGVMKQFLICLLVLGLSQSHIFAQQNSLSSQFEQSFETGNIQSVAKFFGETIELQLLENQNFQGKNNVSNALDHFLKLNPTKSFEWKHVGNSKNKSSFYIGLFSSKSVQYRVHVKASNDSKGQTWIDTLEITKE